MIGGTLNLEPILPPLAAAAPKGLERVPVVADAQHSVRGVPCQLLCFGRPRLHLFLRIACKVVGLRSPTSDRKECR